VLGVLVGLTVGPIVAVVVVRLLTMAARGAMGSLLSDGPKWLFTAVLLDLPSLAAGAAFVLTTWAVSRAPWDGLVPCALWAALYAVRAAPRDPQTDGWRGLGPWAWPGVIGLIWLGGAATCWLLARRQARRTRQQGSEMTNANQERFARAAQTWDDNPARVVLADAIAEAIRSEVPVTSEMDAMDCGCGTGLLTLALQPHVRSILGVDASAEMLKVLEEKIAAAGIANVRARQSDLAEGDLGGESFDLVVSAMMLHHVKDAAGMVERLAGTLRPGGHLCIADLDAEDGSFHPDRTGIEHFGFGEEQIRGMFAAAGLGNVRVRVAHVIARPDAEGVMREYPALLTVGERGEG
jgi:tRNA (cmo5U34)-methyltransferase